MRQGMNNRKFYPDSNTSGNMSRDKVHPQVTVSDINSAREEPLGEFDCVISCCQDSIKDHIPKESKYHHFNMADGPHCDYGGDHSYEMFEQTAQTILDYLQDGETVLVHCHEGKSRSASTSIAALAVHEGTDYHEMYDRVEEERPQIHPDGLLEQHAQQFIEERSDVSHEPFETHRIEVNDDET